MPNKLWSLITWWQKYYLLPSGPGRIHTPKFHSSPQEWYNLTTRIAKHLVHLTKYIRGTRNLTLIMSANGIGILKWWIDRSFLVHPNIRGHTGGGLSIVRGFPIVSSTKHNLNTWSSTKVEGVSVHDYTPYVLWNRYWLDAQGCDAFENIVNQYNKSDIILGKNRKASRRNGTNHINTIYYLLTYFIWRILTLTIMVSHRRHYLILHDETNSRCGV